MGSAYFKSDLIAYASQLHILYYILDLLRNTYVELMGLAVNKAKWKCIISE